MPTKKRRDAKPANPHPVLDELVRNVDADGTVGYLCDYLDEYLGLPSLAELLRATTVTTNKDPDDRSLTYWEGMTTRFTYLLATPTVIITVAEPADTVEYGTVVDVYTTAGKWQTWVCVSRRLPRVRPPNDLPRYQQPPVLCPLTDAAVDELIERGGTRVKAYEE